MATKKQGAAVGKKSGATKKGGATLTAIDGGKATPKKAEAKAAESLPLLRDGKTPANVEAMKAALGVYGVAFKKDATPEELLKKVRGALEKKLKDMDDDDKVKCSSKCTEVSTDETDHCPFCGDEGMDDDAGAAEAAEQGEPEPDPEPKPDAEKPAKGKAKKAEKPAAAAIASKTDTGLAAATAKLDESVNRINQLRTDLALNSYDLGEELRKIHEEELWKARGRESFKDFIENDLDISRSMAYRLIDVTKEFDRETFNRIGSRKLALIAGIADSEARDAALESAKAGATTNEVRRQVDDAKGKKTAPPKEGGGKTAPAPKKGNEITLLTKVGARPQLIGFRSAASGRPIQAHKDDAYAEMNLSEDVKLRMAPKFDREGSFLGITVAFVRVE